MRRGLCLIPLAALLLLAGCSGTPTDPARRANALHGTTQGASAATSGSSPNGDSGWDRVMQMTVAPWPTTAGVQCPGATNAEIDAALQSNGPWVCYAATREAAK